MAETAALSSQYLEQLEEERAARLAAKKECDDAIEIESSDDDVQLIASPPKRKRADDGSDDEVQILLPPPKPMVKQQPKKLITDFFAKKKRKADDGSSAGSRGSGKSILVQACVEVLAPSKSVSIVAKPPSEPQAEGVLAAFFAPRQPRAKPDVSSSASPVQDPQGAVLTYSWRSIGASILAAAKRKDTKVALDDYYKNCPLAPLHSSHRGKVVEEVAKRFDTLLHPHVIVQDAEITGQRKRSNTAHDYLFGTESTEVKGGMFQFVTSKNGFKANFTGIKKELHNRCLLVLVKGEEVEIYEFDSSVLPNPMPRGGSRKNFHASRNQRNLISAASQISRKMSEQCRFLGRVRFDDPHYADLFEACIARGPIDEAYAASCPLHEVPNSRGIIIEEVVADVLTLQHPDCTITHLGGISSYDIKCEINSKNFYLRFLESKLGEDVFGHVESYIEPLKFEVKSSTIHSYSNDGGTFNIAFTSIERSKFDKLYVAVCLPTSIEVFLHDGASGAWTKNSGKGENLIYAAYGTDFGYSRGNQYTKARKNLLDLKTDWQEVWTVIKQKKMNKCKHIVSIRF